MIRMQYDANVYFRRFYELISFYNTLFFKVRFNCRLNHAINTLISWARAFGAGKLEAKKGMRIKVLGKREYTLTTKKDYIRSSVLGKYVLLIQYNYKAHTFRKWRPQISTVRHRRTKMKS